jgi:ADP-ribosylglycohydrolase
VLRKNCRAAVKLVRIALLGYVAAKNDRTTHLSAARHVAEESDTIAAIVGGIAEALHGIPNAIAVEAWAYLPKEMQAVLTRLYEELPD